MLAEQLKETTRDEHASLEKKLVGQIKAIRSQDDYSRLLRMMYGYYSALENRLDKFVNPDNIPNHNKRRKSGAILHDLESLSAKKNDIPLCEQLPTVNSYAGALGAMYVLEGSTLGGKVISQMLSKQVAFPVDKSLSFFNGYGDDTMAMWQSFKTVLQQCTDEQQRQEACAAASQTFIEFKNWIEHNDEAKL